MLDIETREEIREAQQRIWEGQHWTRTSPTGGTIWPESVVIIERSSFLFGGLLTMAITPHEKLGRGFPMRADVLVDNFELTYDPVHHVGVVDGKISDYEITLSAIMDSPYSDAEKLKAQARGVLQDTPWVRDQEEAPDLVEIALEDDNPDMYKGP